MNANNEQADTAQKELATKNRRLAIILGMVAVGFYVGFILFYWN